MNATGIQSVQQTGLRKSALAARRSLGVEARNAASTVIANRVIRSHEFAAANTIACYLPMRDEVDPGRIIERAWRAKKRVFAPVTGQKGKMTFRPLAPDTRLERNHFGLWEPISAPVVAVKALDLIITPLVAFDSERNRIGMGGGYFDRSFAFLKHRKHWLRPKLIGLAFECQEVEAIVPNPWDIRVYRVFSEKN